jgi:hypothetical protein
MAASGKWRGGVRQAAGRAGGRGGGGGQLPLLLQALSLCFFVRGCIPKSECRQLAPACVLSLAMVPKWLCVASATSYAKIQIQ